MNDTDEGEEPATKRPRTAATLEQSLVEDAIPRLKGLRNDADGLRLEAKNLRLEAKDLRSRATPLWNQAQQFRGQGNKDSAKELEDRAEKLEDRAEKLEDRAGKYEDRAEKYMVEANELVSAVKKLSERPVQDPEQAVEEGIRAGTYQRLEDPPYESLIERDEALRMMTQYIRDCIQAEGRVKDKKFPLLGTSGMKGIGKSALLWHGVHAVVPAVVKELAGKHGKTGLAFGAKAFYLTFNGGTSMTERFLQAFKAQGTLCYGSYSNAFGSALLACCGVEQRVAEQLSFAKSLMLYRKIAKMSAEESLVLMVDEVGELNMVLDKQAEQLASTQLLAALMRQMDEDNGKLVFVFSHIQQAVLNELTTASGREVVPLPLPALPIDVWARLPANHAGELSAAARQSPGLHQLLLSLCGHPRSVFDGLHAAIQQDRHLLKQPSKWSLMQARNTIVAKCKFNGLTDEIMLRTVPKWFDVVLPLEKEELARDGLLLTIKSGKDQKIPDVELLHPLVLQWWAERHDSPMARHLHLAYAHDAELGPDSEKSMEGLMYHYEAVLRLALRGQLFSLQSFYKSKHMGAQFTDRMVSAKVPRAESIVREVDNFNDVDKLLELLNDGFIVVSKAHNEFGIEYLAPFFTSEGNRLLVAAVQCKFVAKSANWQDIAAKIRSVIRTLALGNIKCFPVVYTTADQSKMMQSTFADGVYFIASDVFHFTKKLGIIRLHTEKLGKALKQMYPWLDSESTRPT